MKPHHPRWGRRDRTTSRKGIGEKKARGPVHSRLLRKPGYEKVLLFEGGYINIT